MYIPFGGVIDHYEYQVGTGNALSGKLYTYSSMMMNVTFHRIWRVYRIPPMDSSPSYPGLDSLEVTFGVIFPNFLLCTRSGVTK